MCNYVQKRLQLLIFMSIQLLENAHTMCTAHTLAAVYDSSQG